MDAGFTEHSGHLWFSESGGLHRSPETGLRRNSTGVLTPDLSPSGEGPPSQFEPPPRVTFCFLIAAIWN